MIRNIKTIVILFLLLLSISITPSLVGDGSNYGSVGMQPETKELYLLRVEHYLELIATESTGTFSVTYAFPPDYGFQVPILLDLHEDSTADIIHYSIDMDSYEPNRVANFTIRSLQKDERKLIHFSVWVLVEAYDFKDIPTDASMPNNRNDVPEDTWMWLSRSEMVQKNRFPIRRQANALEGRNDNVLSYAQNVSSFIKNHRYGLFLLQLWTRMFLKQDALTTLRINGENVGRSHLASALFRAKNIPARVILAHNDQGFWTQMHYMVEYYIPGYGWVLLDPTKGITPYDTQKQVINRICSIDDEQDTKQDYIYRFMKGEERWIWISTNNVEPNYVDCDSGSKSKMFTETIVSLKPFAADYAFFRTQNVFNQYERFLGSDLSSLEQQHLDNAIQYQKDAVNQLIQTGDINDYIFYLEKSYDEYKMID
ncbi:MAG: transglutaminase-like domain-containing protein [Candidatus Thermoplasmatota archaeon]|nr:transglutaminase-like domain-containing protein [Candidatus Thermoplasmatota archaeon]